MGFKCGLVGLPNVGKSTLFTALSSLPVERAKFPFATVEPNRAIVPVKDERLEKVAGLASSTEITPTTLVIVDIAGLIEGASQGEGLGNRFLAHIRKWISSTWCGVLKHRMFHTWQVNRSPGQRDCRTGTDPGRSGHLERRLEKVRASTRHRPRIWRLKKNFLKNCAHLYEGKTARSFAPTTEKISMIDNLQLLTAKPVVYVVNIDEEDLSVEEPEAVKELKHCQKRRPVIGVCS